MDEDRTDNPLTLKFGNEELVIRRRYELISIINDFFIAIWFLVSGWQYSVSVSRAREGGCLAVYYW